MPAPTELGRMITNHRPINPLVSLTICACPGAVVGAGLGFGPVGSPAIAVLAFVLMTALLVGLFAESLFVRQQLFEGGMVLSSTVPLTPRYAIPYPTIDADSIDARAYHRPRGAADVTDAFRPCYRQAPTVGVVSFVGLAPALARGLARGRRDWAALLVSVGTLPAGVRPRSSEYERWYVSFRDNRAAAELLRERVRGATGGRAA